MFLGYFYSLKGMIRCLSRDKEKTLMSCFQSQTRYSSQSCFDVLFRTSRPSYKLPENKHRPLLSLFQLHGTIQGINLENPEQLKLIVPEI